MSFKRLIKYLHIEHILLTEITAVQNEVALFYHILPGLAVIFAIFSGDKIESSL